LIDREGRLGGGEGDAGKRRQVFFAEIECNGYPKMEREKGAGKKVRRVEKMVRTKSLRFHFFSVSISSTVRHV